MGRDYMDVQSGRVGSLVALSVESLAVVASIVISPLQARYTNRASLSLPHALSGAGGMLVVAVVALIAQRRSITVVAIVASVIVGRGRDEVGYEQALQTASLPPPNPRLLLPHGRCYASRCCCVAVRDVRCGRLA
ncbi:hypothetical protein Dimus_026154 [Dionaea muscipula]